MRLSYPELEILPHGSSYEEDNTMHRSPIPYSRFIRGPDLNFYTSTDKSDALKHVRSNPLANMTASSPTLIGVKQSPAPTQTRERKPVGSTTSVLLGKTNAKLPRPLGTARGAKQRLVYTPSQLQGLTVGEKQKILDASEDTEIGKLRDMLVNNQVRNYYANDEDSVVLDAVRSANASVSISLPNINRQNTNCHRRAGTRVKLRDLEEAMDSFKTSRKANLEEFYEINAKWFGRPLKKPFRPGTVGRTERKRHGDRPMTEPNRLTRMRLEEDRKAREIMSSDIIDRGTDVTNKRAEILKHDSPSRKLQSGDDNVSKASITSDGAMLTLSDLLALQIRNSTGYGASTTDGLNGKKRSVRFSVSNEVHEYDSSAPVRSPTDTTPK